MKINLTTIVLLAVNLPTLCLAGEPQFRRHEVDAKSELAAAAAIDVNHDGKLDIVTGAAWYEAPTWKKHVVREVEFIRGRYDDYSCLPLDVNGDGWTDFVTANYRSEKLAWIEHPGQKLGAWTEHVIEKPGPMETGRLYDVNGDGRLDILPNGRDFAAWWEFADSKAGPAAVRWVRHDLPPQVIGHGVGFGDINGDGRGDVIGPAGWAEAPADRSKGTWTWHGEFQLGRDASVPILAIDVDADGDNDIVWGRGHSCGVCWLEQVPSAAGERSGRRDWITHTIDTSWTQPHTIEAADLDNDGRLELVAGKRYLGHDGKDLGEWDPLSIYWYKFNPATRAWRRGTISADKAGFDLDNKLIDLDGDGDLDLVTAGRSGVYWFENLLARQSPADAVSPVARETPKYEDRSRLLTYVDDAGRSQPVKTPADWAQRRAHVRDAFQAIAGTLPDSSRRVPLDVQTLESVDAGKYTRTRLTYLAEPGDRVPAYLLVPKDLKKAAPAMLCLHQTTKLGKDEPAGVGGNTRLPYAHELAQRGYVCLVPDYPSMGEYQYDFAGQDALPSGTMKAVWNNIRGIDLLESRPEVDVRRIGVIGHSLGGHNAIFTALFDLRLRAIVSSCGFTALSEDDLESWTGPRYMPRLRSVAAGSQQALPFEFHELIAALAPRPFYTHSPLKDSDFSAAGVRKVMAAAGEVYELHAAADRVDAAFPDTPHDFPTAQREAAYEWLGRMLK